MGFFDKIKQGLAKTVRLLKTDIRDLFKTEGQLVDEEFLDKLFEMLIKTDMGVASAQDSVDEVRVQYRGRVVQMADVLEVIKTKLKSLLGGIPINTSGRINTPGHINTSGNINTTSGNINTPGNINAPGNTARPEEPIRFAASGPTVVMVCGVNGCGKTTSIAKLAAVFRAKKKKVVLGAADTFRAAATEQLTVWAQRLGVDIVVGPNGTDPASVAHQAVAKAVETKADVCIIDTAGRLQTQQNLMRELEKIHRVIGRQIPDAPHEVILVLDATTGQNGISQARHFTELVQCTGIILTKLDGTAKGGVVVAIRRLLDLPVKYVGVGESADDLVVFEPAPFVDAMFEQ